MTDAARLAKLVRQISPTHPWRREANVTARALFDIGCSRVLKRSMAVDAQALFEAVPLHSKHWSLLDSCPQLVWLAQTFKLEGPVDQIALAFEVEVLRRIDDFENTDVLYGLAGLGRFLIQQAPPRTQDRLLPRVLKRLDELKSASGLWPDPETKRGAILNLGLAHGLPGLLLFYCDYQNFRRRRRSVLPEIRQLVGVIRSAENGVPFPAKMNVETGARSVLRQGWCYGAPGVSFAMAYAARTLKSRDLQDWSVDLFLRSAARHIDRRDRAVPGSFICHGSAGLALIGLQLGRLTGEKSALRDLTKRWVNRTFDELESEVRRSRLKFKLQSQSLLVSPLGAMLVLMSGIEPRFQSWMAPLQLEISESSAPRLPLRRRGPRKK
jgi:hypothetical protein